VTKDVQDLLANAARMQRTGNVEAAIRLYEAAGEHPVALNALGVIELGRGKPAAARGLFLRAVAADPHSPELCMNLAKAHRSMGDDPGEQDALEAALSLDQRHFMALVRLAELWERRGDMARAAERWAGVLAMSAAIDERSPELDRLFQHAREYVARHQATFAAALDEGLANARSALPEGDLRRFNACVDHLLGRRSIYANEPHGLHFPFLPADEFFDRRHFPWMAELEPKTRAIRAELEALLRDDQPGILPYVSMAPGTPTNKWSALDNKLDWGAFHLWKNGQPNESARARCPQTAAIVEALPLARIPGHAPTVFFSLLQPGAHLPAHTGVTNVRAIIHLPLIVPSGCAFRVGGETREWRAGEAWAFDDTIEHEAWNKSGQTRAVLIFDVWNPHLTPAERDLICRYYTIAAQNGFGAGPSADEN
jgi:aspartate beta-hydroxylase